MEIAGSGAVELVRRLEADADAPRIARNAAAGMLAKLRCGRDRADDLALCVSELVTNAVVHGPGGDLELTLVGTRAMIRVEVADTGTVAFEWPADPGERHRGLGLVRLFSDRAGVTRRPSTVAWCELDLAQTA